MNLSLPELAEQYLDMKQTLGYRCTGIAPTLRSFVRFAEQRKDTLIRSETVFTWLNASTKASAFTQVNKLRVVRKFAISLRLSDPRHELPPDCLGQARHHRPTPFVLSLQDIDKVLAQALQLPPANTITPLTWHYFFGLIAATGLRVSEALELTFDDLTANTLIIRNGKFGKTRMIVLHRSVIKAIDQYLQVRHKMPTTSRHLFVLASGKPPGRNYPSVIFRKLCEQVGLRQTGAPRGPTPHSLRHAFAIRSLEHLNHDADISRHMLALATYLGHCKVSNTYWYLEVTQTLLQSISQATEQHQTNHRRRP